MAKLTHKQKLFIDSLVLDKLNLPNAYKIAFGRPDMTPKQASNAAADLMKKQHVVDAVDELENRLKQAVVDKHAEATLGDVEERRAFVWNSLKNIVLKATAEGHYDEATSAAKLIGEMGGCGQFMPAIAAPAVGGSVNVQVNNQAGENNPAPGQSPLDRAREIQRQLSAQINSEQPPYFSDAIDAEVEVVIEAGA